jgi:hypothetical protein
MWETIKNNPVRIMEVVTAICALLAFYFGDVPWPLVIAVFAAIVGGGETVRAKVTPMRKLEEIKPTTSVYDSTVRMKADDEKVYVWHPGKKVYTYIYPDKGD